jgi:hypothetical protein
MAIYEAYMPPAGRIGGEPADALLKARFVKDALAPLALFIPFLWLLLHGLWLETIAYVLIAIGTGAIMELGWPAIGFALSILPGLYLFIEGRELVAAKLRRKGWRLAGVVEADSKEAAERRFFENTDLSTLPAAAAPGSASTQAFHGGRDPWAKAAGVNDRRDRPEFGIFADD